VILPFKNSAYLTVARSKNMFGWQQFGLHELELHGKTQPIVASGQKFESMQVWLTRRVRISEYL
jgi:hypothetical protein